MISPALSKALMEQMKNEYFSFYLYRSIATYFNDIGLLGFEAFFTKQSDDEKLHADKFLAFLKDTRTKNIQLLPIESPVYKFDNALAAMQYTLEHEEFVTASIQHLRSMAKAEENHEVEIFLEWFITEQIEELDLISTLIDRMMIAGDGPGLILIDKELAG